jgi:hypothetical protein
MRVSSTGSAYLAAIVFGLAVGAPQVALAKDPTDVIETCGAANSNPTFTFNKGSAPYGTLYVYYSSRAYCDSTLTSVRRKVTMKAGSGNGSSNDCAKNEGWLPNGQYDARYEANHQTDSKVVKGSVWYLGSHECSKGTVTRTELFLHSQGGNGGSWTDSNYKSEGCIKINQDDRSYLKDIWDAPVYGASKATLKVTS